MGLVGGIKKISWVVILKCSCTLLRSEGSKKKVFVTKSGGFWRKKNHQKWRILNEILTFEKKTTKSGGFCSKIDKKSNLNKILHFWCFFLISFHFRIWVCRDKKRLKILVIVEVQEVTAKSRQIWEFGRDRK